MLNDLFRSVLKKAPEVIANKVISDIERALDEPVALGEGDARRGRKLLRHFARAHEACAWTKLPGPPGRAAFLASALAFLRGKPEEWAIVGLGTVARRSYVREVFVRRGKPTSVGLPVSVQAEIRGHLEAVDGAEIIHVHNHPGGAARDIKNIVLGMRPVTSDADREVERTHTAVAEEAASKTLTRRKVRFFVVENGEIHRYWLPTTGPLRQEAERILEKLLTPR